VTIRFPLSTPGERLALNVASQIRKKPNLAMHKEVPIPNHVASLETSNDFLCSLRNKTMRQHGVTFLPKAYRYQGAP
jgi:hypothetical protein